MEFRVHKNSPIVYSFALLVCGKLYITLILSIAFAILYAHRLILPESIKSQQRTRVSLAVFLITIETQTTAFIAFFIKEEYSRRSLPRKSLSVNDTRMLTLADVSKRTSLWSLVSMKLASLEVGYYSASWRPCGAESGYSPH